MWANNKCIIKNKLDRDEHLLMKPRVAKTVSSEFAMRGNSQNKMKQRYLYSWEKN